MGLYQINCPECNKLCMWFSGNVLDQRCSSCKIKPAVKKEDVMSNNQQLLDSMQQIIAVQNELINFLKNEVERLKSVGIVTISQSPNSPNIIYPQGQQLPYNPHYTPWYQPTTIGGGGVTSLPNTQVFTGSPLPNGGLQGCTVSTASLPPETVTGDLSGTVGQGQANSVTIPEMYLTNHAINSKALAI